MLDHLRNFGSSIFGKVMMAFLLVGLAGFGISGVLTSIGSNTIAHVGGQEITTREFQRAYSNQMNAVAQQTGSVPTADQAMAMGIPGSVLNTLAGQAALDELASRMGLGASDDRLGQMLRDDPSFAGALGQFDRANFQRVLQSAGYTETEYVNVLREGASRQQIISSLLTDTVLPKAALDLINRYSGDRRTVSYYVLTSSGIPAVAPPTEAELAAYLADNQSSFRTKETRKARIMVLDIAALAAGIEVSDADIAAEYEKTKASLTLPETRVIRQVVLNDANKAAFEAGLANGTSFDELVANAGLTPVDLGELKVGDISDAALAETAFSLDEGAFAIIPGALGFRAVQAETVNPERIETLDEARADITQRLKEKAARNKYADVLDGIEELRARLPSARPDRRPFRARPQRGHDDQRRVGPCRVFAAIPAESRTPHRDDGVLDRHGLPRPPRSLSAPTSMSGLISKTSPKRVTRRLTRCATPSPRPSLPTGPMPRWLPPPRLTSLPSIMGCRLISPQRRAVLSPSCPKTSRAPGISGSDLDSNVAAAAFDGPEGTVGSARSGTGNYVVFKVSSVTPPEDAPPQEAEDYIATTWRDALYSAFVTALRDDAGVTIAQGTLSQIIGAGSGN